MLCCVIVPFLYLAMDESDMANGAAIKSPIKRLGSTRKQMFFNSKFLLLTFHFDNFGSPTLRGTILFMVSWF